MGCFELDDGMVDNFRACYVAGFGLRCVVGRHGTVPSSSKELDSHHVILCALCRSPFALLDSFFELAGVLKTRRSASFSHKMLGYKWYRFHFWVQLFIA